MKIWNTKSGYRIIQILSGRSNVFLLTNGKDNILIDTSPEFMWASLERRLNKLNIGHLDCLILTHSHFDHAANASRIREKYNAAVIVHRDEAANLVSGDPSIPQGTNFFTRTILSIFAKKVPSIIRCKPCQYDLLVDYYDFDLNEFGFNAFIMHTPGHSPGSMSVIVDNEVAIVGDTLVGIFKWSVFPPFAYNVKLLIESWGKLLETDCSLFLPSHGSAKSRLLLQKEFNKKKKQIFSF